MFVTQILPCVSVSVSLWIRPLQKSGLRTSRDGLCAVKQLVTVMMAAIVEPVASHSGCT